MFLLADVVCELTGRSFLDVRECCAEIALTRTILHHAGWRSSYCLPLFSDDQPLAGVVYE